MAFDQRTQLECPLARRCGTSRRLVEHGLRLLELAPLNQRTAERAQELEPPMVVLRQETRSALEQFPRRRCVVPRERAPSSAGEHRPGALAESTGAGSARPELEPCRVCLLEVVAQDLVVLRGAVARLPLEPLCEAFVEVRAEGLRQRRVRRVTDEDVAEAESVFAGQTGGLVRHD